MFQSIPHLLLRTIEQYPDNTALKFYKSGAVQSYTYKEFGELIRDISFGINSYKIEEGEKIAILSNNRPEWTITDFAGQSLGNIIIPIYQTLPPNQIEYILKDSETGVIFLEDETQYKKISQIKKHLPKLKYIFSFNKLDIKDVIHFDDILEKGRKCKDSNPDFYEETIAKIDGSKMSTIVYTSGTTGNPKGVMLHHNGFIEEIISSEQRLNLNEKDVFLSFLPLSHLYERVAGHWTPMYVGASIFYSQGIDTVIDDVAVAKPTVIVSVPRLFEKIASKVMEQVEHSSPIKQKLFNWALKTGRSYTNAEFEGKISFGLKRKYAFANKLVFTKIKQKLGGNLRYPIAGGAPLSVDTLKFFEALNMRIIEGYGMTETHLIIALTPFGKTKYGSCGKPINKVDVKISDEGEVLVKSPMLMDGYFKKPELTKSTIDTEGWLHTGDIGYLDEENYLFLTDRIKNILITSGGKNVASTPIENLIKTSKYIEDVCLIGDQKKFLSALIIPDFDILRKWAKSRNLDLESNAQLIENPDVKKFLWEEVEQKQAELARFEKVKKITILEKAFSIEEGELTPSLKIKRKIIMEHYKQQIEKMYEIDNVIA